MAVPRVSATQILPRHGLDAASSAQICKEKGPPSPEWPRTTNLQTPLAPLLALLLCRLFRLGLPFCFLGLLGRLFRGFPGRLLGRFLCGLFRRRFAGGLRRGSFLGFLAGLVFHRENFFLFFDHAAFTLAAQLVVFFQPRQLVVFFELILLEIHASPPVGGSFYSLDG